MHALVTFARQILPESTSSEQIEHSVLGEEGKESVNKAEEDNFSESSSFDTLVTVERLSLVLIRVKHVKGSTGEPATKQAEHLATVSLLGAVFDCHRGLCLRSS